MCKLIVNQEMFSKGFKGIIANREHDQYDKSRAIYNGQINKYPIAIVYCYCLSDIIECFSFIKSHDIPFSIRGSGHNVAGRSVCNNGVVIDLSNMRKVEVNAKEQYIDCAPGTLWQDVDNETFQHKLATPGGIISDTGVAGLTLGGGVGWLIGKHGLSCDNLLEADILLKDGEIVTCSLSENEDIFWYLRGGSGNIGIVTRFRLQLHPLEKVYSGITIFDEFHTKDAIEYYLKITRLNLNDLTVDLVLTTDIDNNKIILIRGCYSGDLSQVNKIRTLITPQFSISSDWSITSYPEFQCRFDDDARRGRRAYWKSSFCSSSDINNNFINELVRVFESIPSKYSMLAFQNIHGAGAIDINNSTSFGHRNYEYLFIVNSNWEDIESDTIHKKWTNIVFKNLNLLDENASYVNYLSLGESSRIKTSYRSETLYKLKKIKEKYDPNNIFKTNLS